MKLYQVLGWDDHFENSKSRERKECGFVCVPNKQAGLGFSRVMAHKHGATIYGIWCLLLGALSRQRRESGTGREGWLTHDGHSTGTPWTVDDLSLLWRRPSAEIALSLDVLSSQAIGWLKCHENQQEADGASVVPVECPLGIVKEGKKEEKGMPASPLPFSSEEFIAAWSDWQEHLKQKRVKTTTKATDGQLSKCRIVGEVRAIAMIRHSIAGNWQGLFEDTKGNSKSASAPVFDDLSAKGIE